jgi:hypothetical protein
MNTDTELIAVGERCRTAVSVAYSRGYEPPAEYVEATRVAAAAQKIANEQLPATPAPPTDPKDVGGWCDEVAAARVAHGERTRVAAELHDRVNRVAMRAVVAVVGDWIARVCDEFAGEVAAFEELVASAPHDVTSSMGNDEFAKHAELLRAVEQLSSSAFARAQLAVAAEEGDEIGRDGAMWLLLDPRPEATLFGVNQTLRDFTSFPTSIDDWQRFVSIGVRMAGQGEVGARRDRFARFLHVNGMSASGGMLDMTFGEAGRLAAAGPVKRPSAAAAGQI